jgi:hypothetical protein
MTPPEMLDEAASPLPPAPTWSERHGPDDDLRTELVHRHLHARLSVAEEQIQILEDHSPAPEVLVGRFAATIQETQRVLDAERAEVTLRVEARRQASEARAAEVLDRARAEAAAIREVAARLRGASLADRRVDRPEPSLDLRDAPAPIPW